MAYVGKITDTAGTTGSIASTLYGTCTTAAGTADKVVTCADFDKLIPGVVIFVKFTNSNTSTGTITMNVNNTGKINMYRYGTTKPGNYGGASWLAGSIVSFTYDGTYWIMNDWLGNDNNYDRTSIQMRIYAGTNGVFPYSIVAMDKNQRMQAMTTTGGTGTSKAFNSSQKFMYPPYIFYHSENSTKTNGQVITNNVLYEQFPNVNMTYSCNITTSAGFAQYKPVYIECTFDNDGYWSPTGITQTFTSGKYYILLGVMYSTSIYQIALTAQHPVFYYDGTNLIDAEDIRQVHTVPKPESSIEFYDIEKRTHLFYNDFHTTGLRIYNRTADFVNFSTGFDLVGLSSSRGSLLGFRWEMLMDDESGQTPIPLKILLTPDNITVGNGIIKTDSTTTPNGFSSAATYGMNLSLDPDVIDRKGTAYYNTGWTDPPPTNVWAKVGSYTTSASGVTNEALRTVFLVSNYNNSVNKNVGILVCSTVIGPQTETNIELKWLVADTNINPSDFVLVLTESTSGDTKTATVELWVKWTRGWQAYIFKPLVEHARAGTRLYWTFYDARPVDGQATYTSGTAHVVSSQYDVLYSDINMVIRTSNLFINAGRPIYFGGSGITDPNQCHSLVTPVASSNTYEWTLPSTSGTLCLIGDSGSATQPVYINGNKTKAVTQPTSGAWFSAVPKIDSSGVLEIGKYIDFHSTSTSTNNYDVRLAATSASVLEFTSNTGTAMFKIAGTLPMLKFQQTTSGKEYNEDYCGITAFAASNDGTDMVMQSGGRMIVGGGEYPKSFYQLSDKIYYDYWSVSNECCYIGADSAVIVHTNYSTPAQRKNFIFTAGGNFAVPPGGAYYFANTVASAASTGSYHKLNHAAGTDSTVSGFKARTWTLPDDDGTVALTEDVDRHGSVYFTTSGYGTRWGKVAELVHGSQTTFSLLLSVSQSLGAEQYKAAGILQVDCVTSAAGTVNATNSRLMWLCAGGNINKSRFVLVGKNSTPESGKATFELWIQETSTYHAWVVKPLQETYVANYGRYFTFFDARNGDSTATAPTGDVTITSSFLTPVTS